MSVKLTDSGIFRPQNLLRLKWGTRSPIKYILAESEQYCMRLFVTTLVAGRTQCSFTSDWGKMECYKKDQVMKSVAVEVLQSHLVVDQAST